MGRTNGRTKAAGPRRKKVALVCAGGGVTGAIYEIGCLRALDELLDRSVVDLDLYVGISGGAFVASLLASGISPREMYDEVTSRASSPFGVTAAPLFRVGALEFLKRARASSRRAPPRLQGRATRRGAQSRPTWRGRSSSSCPPGSSTPRASRKYLHALLLAHGKADRFADLTRPLFVVAVDLDRGAAVAFGDAEHRDVPISRAVQASTALPGLYRPVRIDGRDYVDGGVKKTAHINLAIQNGADLVICLNPLVPITNPAVGGPLRGHLSNRGLTYVLDQVLRIVLHGRMEYGLERYRAEHPEVDILLLEPPGDDLRMFSYNIMRYGARRVVAEHGYRSVLRFFRENEESYRGLLKKAGIGLRDPRRVPETPPAHPFRSPLARALSVSLDRLDSRLR